MGGFTNDIQLLRETELFVLDMDGTFYLSDSIITGSLEFLDAVKRSGRRFMFFTNNSSKDKKLYVEKLARMNCHITENDILTSGDVTIDYIKKDPDYLALSYYVVGTPALVRSFEDAGINLHQDTSDTADAVILGFDMTLTYEKLEHACTLIRNGAFFIATHPDINCPVEGGGFIPDCGAMIQTIAFSTGKTPLILGKPFKPTVDMVALHTGVSPKHITFVGDRIYTDVACGVKNGARGLLVLSGETKFADIEKSDVKPDFVYDRLYSIISDL